MTGLAFAVAAAAVGVLYALDRIANKVVRPVPREPEVTAPELGLPHEDLRIPSGDLLLHGWLLSPPARVSETLVLMAHGWGANYGNLLKLGEPLARAGHAVVLFDVRGHGRNEAVPHATVRDFRDDVLAVTRWAAERFPDRRRILVGHSLGGAAAVLAVGAGAPVVALVLVASPADVLDATAAYLNDKGFPGDFMVVALRPFWWLRLGSTFRGLVPERKIAELTLPILILQPEDDHRVDRDQAERLARRAGRPLHVVPGTGHNSILGSPETHRLVLEFLAKG
jgi:alpha-beta hydrolase superfamily lysophospholipase